MRTGLILLVCATLWLCASCAGDSTPITPTDPGTTAADNGGGTAGLAALPSPREVSEGTSVVEVGPGTSSHFIQTNLHPVNDGVGVTQEAPDYYYRFAEMTPEQLSYKMFIIMQQQGEKVTMGQLSLDLIWQGDTPEGVNGFYVGVADMSLHGWRWLGPIHNTGDILDYSPFELTGDPAMNNRLQVALVNYSAVPVKLKYISFTTINPDDTSGDEELFFVTSDGGNYAINKVLSGDLDTIEPVHQFDPGTEIGGLSLHASDTEQLLIFDRRDDGGNWEVWQSNLDGTEMQVRYAGAGDVRFAGYDAGKGMEFTLSDGGDFGTIQRHNLASGTVDYERDLPGAIVGTPSWYILNSPAVFSLYGTGLDETDQQMTMQYVYYDYGDTDFESYRALLFIPDPMDSRHPFVFNWGYNLDPSNNNMTLYSGKPDGADTFDIRLNITCQPFTINNEVFVGDDTADLDFPMLSPDHKLLSFLRSDPGMDSGDLMVQSAFKREVDTTGVVAENVTGPAVWFDPTPLEAASQ